MKITIQAMLLIIIVLPVMFLAEYLIFNYIIPLIGTVSTAWILFIVLFICARMFLQRGDR